MTSPASASDEPPRGDEAPDREAVTAFVEWDQTLPAGTLLREYEVRSVIGESAFAIVYLAWDHALRRRVAVKEYLPRPIASRSRGASAVEPRAGAAEAAYAAGLKAFVAEARMLARFDHAALVKVYRFWEENGTAYMVMPHCDGPTLERALADAGRGQDEAEVRAWLRPVLDALAVMHAARCYHHHVGPDTIVLTPNGPVLLGFAAARRVVVGASDGPAATAKPGYAPIELYSDAATLAPGPWTDLYALAAVVYRAVGGQAPPAAPERLANDPLQPLTSLGAGRCSDAFLQAIDATLALQPEHRPLNDAEFRELVGGIEAPLPPLPISPAHDLMAEPFGREDDTAREITIPLPTQPYPAPERAADAPMARPFLAPRAVAPSPAPPLPFEREELGLSRPVVIGVVAGVAVLGALAASMLYFYAGRNAEPPAPASAAPAVVAPLRPAAARPEPSVVARPESVPLRPATALVDARPAAAAEPPRRSAADRAPVDAAERRARCADLLQEATLRRLTTAEAVYFKKECR